MPYHRSAEAFDLYLTYEPLSPANAFELIANPACGGVVLFIGTVRNQSGNRNVVRLEYEAQHVLALNELERIVTQLIKRRPVRKVVVHHRLGILNVGETAVIVGAAAPHRKDAFFVCRTLINQVKTSVPIWKHEYFANGERWVGDPVFPPEP